jgi:hypothetical protein
MVNSSNYTSAIHKKSLKEDRVSYNKKDDIYSNKAIYSKANDDNIFYAK